MAQVEATTQRTVDAEPGEVFRLLADYSGTRPSLLPPAYEAYGVREGGTGEGTLAHWRLRATDKRVRDCLVDVTEPTPGELVERDRNSSMTTTWRVTPAGEGRSRVVVTAVWNGAGGVGGFFERVFAPRGLNRIHDEVLAKLAVAAEG